MGGSTTQSVFSNVYLLQQSDRPVASLLPNLGPIPRHPYQIIHFISNHSSLCSLNHYTPGFIKYPERTVTSTSSAHELHLKAANVMVTRTCARLDNSRPNRYHTYNLAIVFLVFRELVIVLNNYCLYTEIYFFV